MIAWPSVVTALTGLLPTLPGFSGVEVYDGPPVTEDRPVDYVTVGYVEDDGAGNWETERRSDYRVEERGEVACHFVSQSGDPEDRAAVRARAFALVDALDVALRDDQTLGGVLSADGTCTLSADVDSVQNPSGSAQSVVVTIAYMTRS